MLIEELQTQKPISHTVYGSVAQYLGSDKRRVLSHCVTNG